MIEMLYTFLRKKGIFKDLQKMFFSIKKWILHGIFPSKNMGHLFFEDTFYPFLPKGIHQSVPEDFLANFPRPSSMRIGKEPLPGTASFFTPFWGVILRRKGH